MRQSKAPDVSGHQAVLFAAAQDVARRHGKMDPRRPASAKHSRQTAVSYTLADVDGEVIARLPIWSVESAARQRTLLLARLAENRKVWSNITLGEQRVQFRTKPFEIRALAWALSNGRRIPQGRIDRDRILLWIVLLLLGLSGLPLGGTATFLLSVPCLIYTVMVLRQHRSYLENLQGLVVRWKAAGKPDPGDNLFVEMLQERIS
jgi:hypothetical protein